MIKMAKNWEINEIPALLNSIYMQILERGWDPVGLIHWGSRLDRGEMTVKSIVNQVVMSQEHMDRFIRGNTIEDGVKILYNHLLNRTADQGGLDNWVKTFELEGVDDVIRGIINSKEYNDKFGEDTPPG